MAWLITIDFAAHPAREAKLPQNLLLSVGFDPQLLRVRNEVLRNSGYNVQAETTVADALRALTSGAFDLIILCHTIPDVARWRLISDIKTAKPSVPVLVLRTEDQVLGSGDEPDLAAQSVSWLAGPQALLDAVDKLLARSPRASGPDEQQSKTAPEKSDGRAA